VSHIGHELRSSLPQQPLIHSSSWFELWSPVLLQHAYHSIFIMLVLVHMFLDMSHFSSYARPTQSYSDAITALPLIRCSEPNAVEKSLCSPRSGVFFYEHSKSLQNSQQKNLNSSRDVQLPNQMHTQGRALIELIST
jgi:hypothetical protein